MIATTPSEGTRQYRCLHHFNRLLPFLGPAAWVAGGALCTYFGREPASDIDVFFPGEEHLHRALKQLVDAGAEKTFENDRIVNLRHRGQLVQLIRSNYFETPQQTIEAFDFTVCCAAVDHERLYFHGSFFEDLAAKQLVVNLLPKPLSTLQRLQKYTARGYRICNGGLMQLARAIQRLDLDDAESNHFEFYPDGRPKFISID